MPVYEYICGECGLKTEKLWRRIALATPTIPCEECGTEMKKAVTAANFTFSHGASQVRGAAPPSTGTSDDYNFDKAIGRDAEQKWKVVEARAGEKDRVVRNERSDGKLVTRDHLVPKSEGGYRVISETERVKANEGRETAFKIAQEAKKKKDPSP